MDSPRGRRRRFRGVRRATQRDTREADVVRERLDHLEASLEALQDLVYRNLRRQEQELDALRKQLQPSNLVRALSEDARRRGL